MRSTILSGVLILMVFLGGCARYSEEKKVEQEERAALEEKVRAQYGDTVAAKLQVPKSKEQVEEVPALTPTPRPTSGLLNKPVDPAGEPDQQQ